MARQVYYDPFGMRTAGYQAGVNDEQAVQGSTRAARQLDWDFGFMNPLRLQQAQREEQFQQYGDPFRRRGLQDAEYDANLARAMGFGTRTGVYAPAQRLDYSRFVPGAEQTAHPELFVDQMNPETLQREFGFYSPTGEFQPYQPTNQGYAEYNWMTDPALAGYTQNAATFASQYEQNRQRMEIERQQIENSMRWLEWQRSQGGQQPGANDGFFFGY
jgi:hypothetical protein